MRFTNKQRKAMEGTEFIYEYSDGDTIRCYVKKYDPKIGLSCFTLDTVSKGGWQSRRVEEDGTWCTIGIKIPKGQGVATRIRAGKRVTIDKIMKAIVKGENVKVDDILVGSSGGGYATCGFMP